VFEYVDNCSMEIRKTWTRSICFSIENHVHIVNVLRWLRVFEFGQRDAHCGDAFVLFFFFFKSCLEKMLLFSQMLNMCFDSRYEFLACSFIL
jgi:hypothetical protein